MLFFIAVIGLCFLLSLSDSKLTSNIYTNDTRTDTRLDLNDQSNFLASDDPITINNDTDLGLQTGSTYVISDRIIDASGPAEHAISISNTQHPFEIRNCTLMGVTDVSALLLFDVSNCTMIDVRVISNEQIGIEMYEAYNITITKSNVTNNWKGISLVQSSNIEISNTTIESNSHTGVFLSSTSRNNEIFWNSFDSNYINAQDDDPTLNNNFTQNFWSDYLGEDVNPRDEIGDTPHIIVQSQGNSDPLPFMLPPDHPPIYWRVEPKDTIRQYGDNIVITLFASVNGGLEGWYLNDSRFSISDSGVITNDDWIPVGSHGFNVTIRNLYFHTLTGMFTLHVVDTIAPTWIEEPVDQVVEIGDTFLYDVNATDLSIPLYYWLVSSPYFEINSATGQIQNNDTLPAYVNLPVHVYVRDAEGNENDVEFTVTPEDTRSPTWSTPLVDQTIEYGFVLLYDIDATDFSGLDIWTVSDSRFQIDSAGILSNATILEIGTYQLEVSVNDTIGNVLIGFVEITVEDTTPPEWVVWPTNQILELGEPLEMQLEVSDNAAIAYWTVSDTDNFDITSIGRLFSIGTLDQVAYTLTVAAYDSSGNSVSAGFSITIQDTLDPTWVSTTTNYTFELGHIVRIPLDAHDYSGITGWLVQESSLFSINDIGVISNATSLSVGTYTLHVSVSDLIGHLLVGVLTIEVRDTTAPIWSNVPTDLYITAPDVITFALSTFDISGIDRWEVNDTEYFIVNDQGVLVGLITLPAGVYNLGITAYDAWGNHAAVAITVHAFGHDIMILAVGAGVWGVTVLLAILVIYIFNPNRRFGKKVGGVSK